MSSVYSNTGIFEYLDPPVLLLLNAECVHENQKYIHANHHLPAGALVLRVSVFELISKLLLKPFFGSKLILPSTLFEIPGLQATGTFFRVYFKCAILISL